MNAGRQGFSRRLRLSKAGEFKRVFRQPCKTGTSGMMLLARRNTLGHPRLGVAIGRGAVPNAVARNRLKRAIRESFRHRQAYVGALDVVVWVRKGFKEMAPGELRETLSACWRDLSDKCAGS